MWSMHNHNVAASVHYRVVGEMMLKKEALQSWTR